MLITIGLCVKRLEEIGKETLQSILDQNFSRKDMELLVVTSFGKKKTATELLSKISIQGITIKLYWDNGKGLAAARQLVVDNANGKYILWVDSDVVLSKDFIHKQVDFIINHPDFDVVIGCYKHEELKEKKFANIVSMFWSLQRIVYFGATICSVEALRQVGGFDSRIRGASEDMDIVLRMLLSGFRLTINSEAKYFHKQRESFGDLFKRGVWYGHGGHFMGHKYEKLIRIPYRLPPIYFAVGVKASVKAYRQYLDKRTFFIPLVTVIFSLGWLAGFVQAHLKAYGHLINSPEINYEKTFMATKILHDMLR